jgi:MFS family permease
MAASPGVDKPWEGALRIGVAVLASFETLLPLFDRHERRTILYLQHVMGEVLTRPNELASKTLSEREHPPRQDRQGVPHEGTGLRHRREHRLRATRAARVRDERPALLPARLLRPPPRHVLGPRRSHAPGHGRGREYRFGVLSLVRRAHLSLARARVQAPGKIGQILGRKRVFAIGCAIYGCGSLITAIAPSLGVLIVGWSFLEGIGAALILPAIVALVASNFARAERPRAYGLVASAGAIAVAAGPLIGGLFTTYLSWRWMFVGEVFMVAAILALTRRMADVTPETRVRLDLVGTALSALGLGLIVFGIVRSGEWGFVQPKPSAPEWLGLSPSVWLMLGGGVVLWLFMGWENRRLAQGGEPLVNPAILQNPVLRGGLTAFFFQYLLQAGLFFAVPLFLSVALGLSAVATGVRLLPLSITLLLAAAGIPKVFPNASPRRVAQVGSWRSSPASS